MPKSLDEIKAEAEAFKKRQQDLKSSSSSIKDALQKLNKLETATKNAGAELKAEDE